MKKPIKQILSGIVIVFVLCSVSCTLNTTKKTDISAINFKNFSRSISADNIVKDISVFAPNDNARIAGFDGEKKASEYIEEQFKKMGLTVEKQSFPVEAFECDSAEIKVLGESSRTIVPEALTFSAATPEAGITAQLVFASQGSGDALDKLDLKNKIVLMTRGGDYFHTKTANAAKNGALATLFYDEASGDAVSATLVEPSSIPAASLTKTDGEYLKSLLIDKKDVKISMKLNTVMNESQSENIIGTLNARKAGKDIKTIVIGAHFDGVDTPAANDNASGIATVLETARILSKEKFECNIKFIAFGAEEIGCVGSFYYIHNLNYADMKNTIAMLNLDMIGVGNQLYIHTLKDNEKSITADVAGAAAKQMGYEYKRTGQEGSDHQAFEENGIPVAYFECGPENNHHTDRDTIGKIQKDDLAKVCNIVTSTVYELAKNPDKY